MHLVPHDARPRRLGLVRLVDRAAPVLVLHERGAVRVGHDLRRGVEPEKLDARDGPCLERGWVRRAEVRGDARAEEPRAGEPEPELRLVRLDVLDDGVDAHAHHGVLGRRGDEGVEQVSRVEVDGHRETRRWVERVVHGAEAHGVDVDVHAAVGVQLAVAPQVRAERPRSDARVRRRDARAEPVDERSARRVVEQRIREPRVPLAPRARDRRERTEIQRLPRLHQPSRHQPFCTILVLLRSFVILRSFVTLPFGPFVTLPFGTFGRSGLLRKDRDGDERSDDHQ